MIDETFIKKSLNLHNIPLYESDVPYIEFLLQTVMQAQTELNQFPNLNDEYPITIIDKGVIR